MSSYQYRKSHCGDKTILRPSYLHNGISYTGKTTSLHWIRALEISLSCTNPSILSFFNGNHNTDVYHGIFILRWTVDGLNIPFNAVICPVRHNGTVETLYNTIIFCWSTHKRHSIARPKGRGMGCLLWVQRATYCVDLSILSSIKFWL